MHQLARESCMATGMIKTVLWLHSRKCNLHGSALVCMPIDVVVVVIPVIDYEKRTLYIGMHAISEILAVCMAAPN